MVPNHLLEKDPSSMVYVTFTTFGLGGNHVPRTP